MKKRQVNIAIIEDDPYYNLLIELNLKSIAKEGLFEPLELLFYNFRTGESVMNFIDDVRYDIAVLDYFLSIKRGAFAVNGEDILKEMVKRNKECKVLVVSEQEDLETTVRLLQKGAYVYLQKRDLNVELLKQIVSKILIRKYELY
jgi:DNA-binding NtrC family response regulator